MTHPPSIAGDDAGVRAEIGAALDAMAPIGLPEMDSVKLMNRVDTKYILGRDALLRILEDVGDRYRVLSVEGARLSPYETLYCDSDTLDCFVEHHNGKLNRYKYRMRRYALSDACFFEVKFKNNRGRTDKRRVPIDAITEDLPADSAQFAEEVSGRHLDLHPQLWTYFNRITLVGDGATERATFDTAVKFRAGDRIESIPDLVIAEVKQDQNRRDSVVRQALRHCGIRPLRVSKYCLGCALLMPDLKKNRFKQKIAKILRYAR